MTIEEIKVILSELDAALSQVDGKLSDAQNETEVAFYTYTKETLGYQKEILEYYKTEFASPLEYGSYDSLISTTDDIKSTIDIVENFDGIFDGGDLNPEKAQEVVDYMTDIVSLGKSAETTVARYILNYSEDEINDIVTKYDNSLFYLSMFGNAWGLYQNAYNMAHSNPEDFDYESLKKFTGNFISTLDDFSEFVAGSSIFGDYGDKIAGSSEILINGIAAYNYLKDVDTSTVAGSVNYLKGMAFAFDAIGGIADTFGGPVGNFIVFPFSTGADLLKAVIPTVMKEKEQIMYMELMEYEGYNEVCHYAWRLYMNEEIDMDQLWAIIHGQLAGEDVVNGCLEDGIQTKDDAYGNASKAVVRDPLAIDLGEKGIELTTVDDGVYFDLDNNGFAEKTAWIGTEDGFLVMDRNKNGSIDNGGELFGDQVWLSNGYVSVSGFDALKELDSNGDGIIDDKDEAFASLRVWIDASHDGISQDGELKTFGDLGIQSISLEVTRDREFDNETGTLRSESAVVNYADGTTTKISEFLFNVDTVDSVSVEGRVKTIGNIPDIMSAIDADESGELSSLYESFVNAPNPIDKRLVFSEILYKITGASEIEAGSRGVCIDARCLHVIEKFMGREFIGVGGPNPNSEAAKTLNNLYSDIENTYYLKLLMSTDFAHTSNTVFEYTDEDGNKHLDTSVFDLNVMSSIGSNENIDVLLYDMSIFLNSYDNVKGTEYLDEFKRFYSLFSDHYKGLMEIAGYSSTLIDLDKKDLIYGTSNNDYIFGQEGNDTIYAGNGNDVIVGDVGNDILQGGSGNDTYRFNLGDGNDMIFDKESLSGGRADRIIFGEGIKKEDVTIDRDGDYLRIKYSDSDSILIQDAYRNIYSDGSAFIENIEFADGTVMNINDINREAAIREGTDENDTMYGYANVLGYDDDEIFHGRGGNDAISAYDGDDTLYGEEGNDNLYAGNGDDTLIGGVGDDLLQGDSGNDTYLFNLGDGNDRILDIERGISGKADRIIFEEGIKKEDLTIDRDGDNLRIKYSDNDSILIQDAYRNIYSDGTAFVENIEFADGTVMNSDEINREAAIRIGNDDGNTWYGYASAAGYDDDETFYGRGGNDAIYANDGDDTLYGEEGNDYLYAGNGDDTLIGGVGNDRLQGDAGNDTYLINLGDGNDTIFDMERGNGGKEDRIIFGEGIKREDLTIDREYDSLRIKYSDSDSILIQDTYKNSYSDGSANVEYIEFADGTVINLDEINREAAIRIGNDDGNTWYGYASAAGYDDDETFYGRGGNDAIYANDGDDTLYGEEGNDYLYAGNGDDTLIGGVGTDRLQGDAGNDTYLFNLGDGNDSIYDREVGDGGRADKIVFGEGIKKEDLTINREGDNLRICYSDSDSISILDAYRSNNTDGIAQVEFIEFSDSSVHSINYDTVSLDLVHDAVTEDAEEEVIVDSTEALDEIEEVSDEAEVLADVEEITDDTDVLAEVVESAVESDETEDDIESMASLANEFMSEQEDEDSVISDESGIMDEIDNMVNLAIQDMSEDASANVGDSDKLFDESSSSDYDQLWVVNE